MNLKNILTTNTPAEIIDLINYNFDQLVANGYGAPGAIGAAGAVGTDGVQGVQGNTGSTGGIGNTGSAGSVANIEWTNDTSTVSGTNIMVPSPSTSLTTLTTVTLGDDTLIASNEHAQLVVGRNTVNFDSNIRLTVPGSVNYFDFAQDVSKLTLGFNAAATNTLFKVNGATVEFSDNADSDSYATFTPSIITFKKDVTFDSDVLFNDTMSLAINGTANAGDILVAGNDDGLLEWAPPSSIGANVPIGTVISILGSVYNNTNFDISATGVSSSDLTTQAGIGRVGTEYEGWYLCHGYTWFNYSQGIAYNPPTVGSNKFTDNNQSTPLRQDTDNTILSGAKITVEANVNSTIIETEIDTTKELAELGTDATLPGHEPIDVVRLPHIVYLGTKHNGTAITYSWRYIDVSAFGGQGGTAKSCRYLTLPSTTASNVVGNIMVNGSSQSVMVWQSATAGSAFATNSNTASRVIYTGDGILGPKGWYMRSGNSSAQVYGYWKGTEWDLALTGTFDASNPA